MLDVHPPHHAASTWRDFFIHIATIVIGLLIAVGLEQSVEWLHHRHQVAETREALRLEREENYTRLDKYVKTFRWESVLLNNNMMIFSYLRQHPGTPEDKLPGVLKFTMMRNQFETSAWHTAQSSGVLQLMPKKEVLADEVVYNALQDICNQNEEEWLALNDNSKFMFEDSDPSHLTPAEITEQITLTQRQMMKHGLRGNFMEYPHSLDSAFVEGPSREDLSDFHKDRIPAPGPDALTLQRMVDAGYVPRSGTTKQHNR